MEKNDDAPEDVKRATSVEREIKKGEKDDTFEGYPRIQEKKKRWEHCDKSSKKSKRHKAKSNGDCCETRREKKKRGSKFAKISVFGEPCTFPKQDIIPRHCLTKSDYLDILATPSRKCPPDCHKQTVLRRLKPVSPRIKELALPTRHRLLITLQEGAAILPPALLDNLVKTLEDETCLTPEQAAVVQRKKKASKKKKEKKDQSRLKEPSKPKKQSSVGPANAGSFDKDAVLCQYLIAEHFVKSILKSKCPIPKSEFNDVAEVIVRRLVDVLEYTPQIEDRKSQQLRFLADVVACWMSGVMSEVAELQKEKLEERCKKKKEEMEREEEEEEDEDEDEYDDKDEDRGKDYDWLEDEDEGEKDEMVKTRDVTGDDVGEKRREETAGVVESEALIDEEIEEEERDKDVALETEPVETVEAEAETEPEKQDVGLETPMAEAAEVGTDAEATAQEEARAEAEAKAEQEAKAKAEEEAKAKAEEEAKAKAEEEAKAKAEEEAKAKAEEEAKAKAEEEAKAKAEEEAKAKAEEEAKAEAEAKAKAEAEAKAEEEAKAEAEAKAQEEAKAEAEAKAAAEAQPEDEAKAEEEAKAKAEEEAKAKAEEEAKAEAEAKAKAKAKAKAEEEAAAKADAAVEEPIDALPDQAKEREEEAPVEEAKETVRPELETETKPKEDVPKDKVPTEDLEDLFKSDLPFITFGKIIDTVYQMIENTPENTGEDPITNGIHRVIYEKLTNIVMLEDPSLLTEELKDIVDVVCGKIANWLRSLMSKSQLEFMEKYMPVVESKEIRDWTKWLESISDAAIDWNIWIRGVIEKIVEMKGAKVTRGEWKDWTKSVDTGALLWRRFHLQTVHQAHRNVVMMLGRHVVKTGTKAKTPNTSEQLINTTELQT